MSDHAAQITRSAVGIRCLRKCLEIHLPIRRIWWRIRSIVSGEVDARSSRCPRTCGPTCTRQPAVESKRCAAFSRCGQVTSHFVHLIAAKCPCFPCRRTRLCELDGRMRRMNIELVTCRRPHAPDENRPAASPMTSPFWRNPQLKDVSTKFCLALFGVAALTAVAIASPANARSLKRFRATAPPMPACRLARNAVLQTRSPCQCGACALSKDSPSLL